MADQVSKSMTTIGWVLISIIGIVVGGGFLYGLVMFLGAAAVAIWIRLLVLIGLVGLALLMAVVIRDRVKEHKTDKYKDIEV